MIEHIIYIIVSVLFTAFLPKIISKIYDTIKKEKQQHKLYPKIEKNAVLLAPFPIVKSPKGYIYYPDSKKKTLYCGKCYTSPSNLTLLIKTGGRLSKKYVCPVCKTEYKG
jgi:hypothetical protein